MTPSPTKSPAWLLEYSERHVAYEFFMLRRLAHTRLPKPTEWPEVRDAMIESFALHLRAVVFFFQSPRTDDVVAQDFLKTGLVWDDTLVDKLSSHVAWASKQILHLTQERHGRLKTSAVWNPAVPIPLLFRAVQSFLRDADPDRLHADARLQMERLIGPAGPEGPHDTFFTQSTWQGATAGTKARS